MNWVTFAIVAWICLGLETGLRDVLQLNPTAIAPSFVLPLMVFVAIWAPSGVAMAGAMLLGLLVDLTGPIATGADSRAVVAGPHALGYLGASVLILNVRGMVIRRNPVSVVALTVLAGIVSGIVVVALHTLRSMYDPMVWDASGQLLTRLASALYSGVTALALSLILFPALPLFAFATAQASAHTRGMRRHA
ncbi:MAG: hypothetical protein H6811_11295 [Phycisphaeraceae bacterium]|nr:hypothetical protein [Phycisphaeraceae bacterium]